MKPGSLVMYTGDLTPNDLSFLSSKGLKPLVRDIIYEVESIFSGKNNLGRKVFVVQIDAYPEIGFDAQIFTEVQGPDEVNIAELLESTVPAELAL